MRAIVREEVDRGATVFFSSHIMEQVEAICDHVGIMRDGALIAEDTIERLKDEFDADAQLIVTVDAVPADITTDLQAIDGISAVEIDGNDIVVSLVDDGQKAAALRAIEKGDVTVEDISSRDPSLEDLFASLTTEPVEAVKR